MRRTAILSGSSTGIGKATALALAGSGWTVLAGIRKEADGEALVRDLPPDAKGRIEPVRLDVTREADIDATAALARSRGPLHAVINNAGIPVVGPVETLPISEWRRQFEVNLFGAIALTRACLPMLRETKGRIVLVSSIAGLVGQPFMSPYCASKHAMEALGDALRLELRTAGVQTTLIEPGAIKTPIWERGREQTAAVEAFATPELRDLYGKAMDTVKKAAADAEAGGLPAEVVANAIERALTARRAPARVIVGRDARVGAILKRVLPGRVFDGLIRRMFGLV